MKRSAYITWGFIAVTLATWWLFPHKNTPEEDFTFGPEQALGGSGGLIFVGSTTASALNPSYPTADLTALQGGVSSSVAEGDFIIVVSNVVGDASANAGVTTFGFTELYENYQTDDYPSRTALSYKFATATPDTSVQCQLGRYSNQPATCVVHVWRGVRTDRPIGNWSSTGGNSSQTVNPPAIYPSANNGIYIIAGGFTQWSTDCDFTFSTGYLKQTQSCLGGGAQGAHSLIAFSTTTEFGLQDPSALSGVGTDVGGAWNGATLFLFASSSSYTEFVTADTNWLAPTGVSQVFVEAWGGGGGGGDGTNTGGGGGGGGAYAAATTSVTAGSYYYIDIGDGGQQGATGGAGNIGATTTWATTTIVAQGGRGGAFASAAAASGGAGGTVAASTGDVEYAGGPGGSSNNTSDGGGGGGGAGGSTATGGTAGNADTSIGGVGGRGSGTYGGTGGTAGNAAAGGTGNATSTGDGAGGGGGGDNTFAGGNGAVPGGGGGGGEENGSVGTGDGGQGMVRLTYTIVASGGSTVIYQSEFFME